MQYDLTLVIPAHNEADRIEAGFERLRPVLEQLGPDCLEVIVVDDGSSDGTGTLAARAYGALPHFLAVRQEVNLGKGAAVRLGFSLAEGKRVAVLDADMAILPLHLPALLFGLEQAPIAAGSRAIDGAIHYDSALRTWSGAAFNALVRRRTGTELRDTQCGFKGFTLGAARLLGALGLVNGFAYDVEVLFLAERLGLGVVAIPVTWDDVKGSSVRLVRDSRRMWRDINSLRHNNYDCPVVRTAAHPDLDLIGTSARAARQSGLVVAHNDRDAIVVLPRNGALAGIDIAQAIGGLLSVATLSDLAGRQLTAV